MSAGRFFRLEDSGVVEVRGAEAAIPGALQELIARELLSFFEVRLLASNWTVWNGLQARIVGIDDDNDPVVVTFKTALDDDAVETGIEALIWINRYPQQFTNLVHQRYGITLADSGPWEDLRLICLGGNFSDSDLALASETPPWVELTRCLRLSDDVIAFELVTPTLIRRDDQPDLYIAQSEVAKQVAIELQRDDVKRKIQLLIDQHLENLEERVYTMLQRKLKDPAFLERVGAAEHLLSSAGAGDVDQVLDDSLLDELAPPIRGSRAFVQTLWERAASVTDLHLESTPGKFTLRTRLVYNGISVEFLYGVRRTDVRVELTIPDGYYPYGGHLFQGSEIFSEFQTSEVEEAYGGELIWEHDASRSAYRVYDLMEIGGWTSPSSQWPSIQHQLIAAMLRFYPATLGWLEDTLDYMLDEASER